MKAEFLNKNVKLVALVSISMSIIAIGGRLLLGSDILIVILILTFLLEICAILEIYGRLAGKCQILDSRRTQDYQQIEALTSLLSVVKPRLPLPTMRNWAASPDLLKLIAETVLSDKPKLVMEASSGVSTLIIAYCLEQLGVGKVISLEHDAKYAAINQGLLKNHGLDHIATIVYAPLSEIEIRGQKWLWYSVGDLLEKLETPIDLIVIDGPPANIQKLSRYPALEVFYEYMNINSTIILDDGMREDEERTVVLWEKEFADMSYDYHGLEKGAYLIKRKQDPREAVVRGLS